MALRKIIRNRRIEMQRMRLAGQNCSEGAIQIIDGKAKLVSDVFCDGLGACA